MPLRPRSAAAATCLLAVLAAAPAASQDVACADLEDTVVLQVGSTVLPLIRTLGRDLRDADAPITLVFTDGRSCGSIDAISSGTPLTTNLSYIPSTAEAPDWTPDMPPRTCTVPAEGLDIDVIHSDVFVESCTSEPLPDGVASFNGPVLPFVFVVPEASSQSAITAEEAYFAWGFGQMGQASPWTDESFLFTRPNTSGTKITFGANIGVPAARWKGEQLARTSDVINAVAASVNPEASLGIAGGSSYDANRQTLNALAFSAFGQDLAFYPDSTSTSFDKQNVRDGHYALWAPAVFVARVGDDGQPATPAEAYLLGLLQSRQVEPAPDFDATGTIIDLGFIPDCAMKVTRSAQGGELAPYAPAAACHCSFEDRVGAAPACDTCTTDDDCAAGTCQRGFCEE